jgi:hypothetical protein
MSFFTHWACFDCRKSFAKEPIKDGERPRICPDCRQSMIDMGKYFAAPKRLNKKRWEVMKVLADNGYKFQSPETNAYIQNFILQAKNPRIVDVIERIELEKQRKLN